ncbi:TIM-barrel domain-containing protein [Amycolatopsis pretoriensis]|nr:TIM-barrel domain-containing protein [Amycolatopsis pretoriensis]
MFTSPPSWPAKVTTAVVVLVLWVAGLSPAQAKDSHAMRIDGFVRDGYARFEVVTPTLIRLEYAGDGRFENRLTFNAVGRGISPPAFTTDVAGGYREIRTASLVLRYRQNSGPFTQANLSARLLSTGRTAAPVFPSYCVFSTVCEAENGAPTGSASAAYDHGGYTGSGFLAGLTSFGAAVARDVSAIPAAGQYQLTVRYANAQGGDGQHTTRTLSTVVNGAPGPRLILPVTSSWDTWATVSVPIVLNAGTNKVSVIQGTGDSGNVNIDSLAVTSPGVAYPAAETSLRSTAYGAGPKSVLGGWDRSLDNPEAVPTKQNPGLLDRDGWYLLDDTRTALLNADRTIVGRPSHGTHPYQDGYFFGYGRDFKRGLTDLNTLIGPTVLLPRSAYGVWYSRYFGYSDDYYRSTLLPKFRSTGTPIDWLVVDTDWKSPSQWNGWNWNTALFPDPQGFMNWTKQQGLDVALNVHTSIASDDPKFAAANATAGGLISDGGGNYTWDWSNPAHLRSYFDLHRPFDQQGVRTWWLDYCTSCGGATASAPGVAPDNFINQAYADHAAAQGFRGFSFGRIGGAEQGGIHSNYPVGPWSERRNTLQFTGDTPASWDMLAFEARFTPDEAAAGLSNVSHDIGSYHGGHLPDELYARWVQLGTFQPVDRLHSDHGDRLPWDYPGAAGDSAEKFLRLREALVPYTYTLAQQASTTGVPITRPLYLNYPDQEAAYTNSQEYLYGDNVLVAPITSSGGSVSAWIPPGKWTDYFTGTVYVGPSTATITKPLSEMPVLVKAGGILPTRTNYVDNAAAPLDRLTVDVTAGANGKFSLYEDRGERTGPSTVTGIGWQDATRTLTVDAAPGAAPRRVYTLRVADVAAPTAVSLDGLRLPATAWSYDGKSRTITVTTLPLGADNRHAIRFSGA